MQVEEGEVRRCKERVHPYYNQYLRLNNMCFLKLCPVSNNTGMRTLCVSGLAFVVWVHSNTSPKRKFIFNGQLINVLTVALFVKKLSHKLAFNISVNLVS